MTAGLKLEVLCESVLNINHVVDVVTKIVTFTTSTFDSLLADHSQIEELSTHGQRHAQKMLVLFGSIFI